MLRKWSSIGKGILFGILVFVVLEAYAQNTDKLWVEIGRSSASGGGISNNAGESLFPAIAIGADGNPIVCWENDDADFRLQIYVKRWNGSRWSEMGSGSASDGGVSNNHGDSTHPAIVIGPNDNPIVCWRDEEGTRYVIGQIYVKRWNGLSWTQMGVRSASAGGISNNTRLSSYPSVATGLDGNPIVCWGQMLGENAQIHVRRWDGTSWQNMGKISVSLRKETRKGIVPPVPHPKIGVGSDGVPILCWADYTCGNWEIYVKHWDGSAWVEKGKGSASGGGISSNTGVSSDPSIAIDRDGRPIVCWADRTCGNREIYVKHWDGSAWVEIGKGSASGGGISNDNRQSMHPDVAVGRDGNIVICWTSGEIYIKRWDGSSWVEMGKGSASGGGISNNIEPSGNPAIANGSDDNPIITFWNGTSDGNREIYVRKFSFSNPPSIAGSVSPVDVAGVAADKEKKSIPKTPQN